MKCNNMRRFILALVLSVLWCSGASAQNPELVVLSHPLARSLVSWWLGVQGFAGGSTVVDLMGRSHGTLANVGLSSTSGWSPSLGNNRVWRLNFDGTNDQATFPSAPTLTNIIQKTICLWTTLRSYGGGSKGRIIDKQDTVSTGWVFFANNVDVTNGLSYSHEFSSGTGQWALANVFTVGIRTHVCMTYDRTSTANVPLFYRNGQLLGAVTQLSTPAGTTTSDANASLLMGASAVVAGRFFDGAMEDIRVFNVVLGPKDIERIYALSLQDNYGLLWTSEVRQTVTKDVLTGLPSLMPFFRIPRAPR